MDTQIYLIILYLTYVYLLFYTIKIEENIMIKFIYLLLLVFGSNEFINCLKTIQ